MVWLIAALVAVVVTVLVFSQVIDFVTRTQLARALDERSDGRLDLDPPS